MFVKMYGSAGVGGKDFLAGKVYEVTDFEFSNIYQSCEVVDDPAIQALAVNRKMVQEFKDKSMIGRISSDQDAPQIKSDAPAPIPAPQPAPQPAPIGETAAQKAKRIKEEKKKKKDEGKKK